MKVGLLHAPAAFRLRWSSAELLGYWHWPQAYVSTHVAPRHEHPFFQMERRR